MTSFKVDLAGKNASILILLLLDILFFAVVIALSFRPEMKDLANKVWELFGSTNGGLLLVLNADSKRSDPPPPPGGPANPTK